MKYIIGVDIGFRATGISVFELPMTRLGLYEFRIAKLHVIKTDKPKNKSHLYVADVDIFSGSLITSELNDIYNEYHIRNKGQVALAVEMPSGGAKGARANRTMGIASGIITCFKTLKQCPFISVTPGQVKEIATGRKSGPKDAIVDYVVDLVPDIKRIRDRRVYYDFLGNHYSADDFTHIADSMCAVFWAQKNSEVYRAFVT